MNYTQRNGSIHQQWIISTLINEKQYSTLGFDLCGEGLRRRQNNEPRHLQALNSYLRPQALTCLQYNGSSTAHLLRKANILIWFKAFWNSQICYERYDERSGLNTGQLNSPLTLVLDLITARYTSQNRSDCIQPEIIGREIIRLWISTSIGTSTRASISISASDSISTRKATFNEYSPTACGKHRRVGHDFQISRCK